MIARPLRTAAALAVAGVLCAACVAPPGRPARPDPPTPDLVQLSYHAADGLLANLRTELRTDRPLLIASLADIDALDRSSTLGRLIAEQVGSRLSQRGKRVTEIKLRGTVLVKRGSGEFVLSRDAAEIGRLHETAAVVAGTYAYAWRSIYVGLRIIRVADGAVLSSYDYRIPADYGILAMLNEY
jgi:hypothetical protein